MSPVPRRATVASASPITDPEVSFLPVISPKKQKELTTDQLVSL